MSRVDNDIEISLSQTVIRADGTREDLGITASTRDGSITVSRSYIDRARSAVRDALNRLTKEG